MAVFVHVVVEECHGILYGEFLVGEVNENYQTVKFSGGGICVVDKHIFGFGNARGYILRIAASHSGGEVIGNCTVESCAVERGGEPELGGVARSGVGSEDSARKIVFRGKEEPFSSLDNRHVVVGSNHEVAVFVADEANLKDCPVRLGHLMGKGRSRDCRCYCRSGCEGNNSDDFVESFHLVLV